MNLREGWCRRAGGWVHDSGCPHPRLNTIGYSIGDSAGVSDSCVPNLDVGYVPVQIVLPCALSMARLLWLGEVDPWKEVDFSSLARHGTLVWLAEGQT